jgi:hypothetical protein
MNKKGLYEPSKSLLFSILCFITGTAIFIRNESNSNYYGYLILSISFGFLATYLAQIVKSTKMKTGLRILSYLVPVLFMIYGAVAYVFQ